MREVVKVVNGYSISRMVGYHGSYTIVIDEHRFLTFKAIKAAVAWAAAN